MKLGLTLTLSDQTVDDPHTLGARGRFTNQDSAPLRFNTRPVSSPSLALLLRRADGTVVPMAPPPVPTPDDGVTGRVDLAPGAAHETHYTNFLPDPLPAGDYELVLRYRAPGVDLASAPAGFRKL
jgi:hypothetical protein